MPWWVLCRLCCCVANFLGTSAGPLGASMWPLTAGMGVCLQRHRLQPNCSSLQVGHQEVVCRCQQQGRPIRILKADHAEVT